MKLIQYKSTAPKDRTITRRKRLAQEIRNNLQAYRQVGCGDWYPQTKTLQRILNDVTELIELEGLTIANGSNGRERAELLTPNEQGGWDSEVL